MNPLRKHVRVLSFFCALGAAVWLFALAHPFDDDEFQHAHMAWLMHHGHKPYVDFFEHHLPAYHGALRGLYGFGGGRFSLFTFRLASWASLMGVLAVVFRLLRRHGVSAGAAGLATLLAAASPIFLFKMIEARPAAPAMLCYTLSLALAMSPPPPPTRRGAARAALFPALPCGLMAGLMVVFSHKFALLAAGPAAAVLLGWGMPGLLAYGLGCLVAPVVGAGLAASADILPSLVECVFVQSLAWRYRFEPTGYLLAFWRESAVLILLGGAGVLAALGFDRSRRQALVLLLNLLLALVTIRSIPVPHRQVFAPLPILLAIGAGAMFELLARSVASAPGRIAAALVLAAGAMLPALDTVARDVRAGGVRGDLARMAAAEATASERFFDGRGLMYYRMHTGRHACMHEEILSMLDADLYAAETLEAIESAGFPTVVFDYRVARLPSAIHDFVRRHYAPIGDDLYVAGARLDRGAFAGGEARFRVPVSGVYRVSWRGGPLRCDGRPLPQGAEAALAAGEHRLAAEGFADRFEALLVRRGDVPP